MKRFLPHTNPVQTWNVNVKEIWNKIKNLYEKIYKLEFFRKVPIVLKKKLDRLDVVVSELLDSINTDYKILLDYLDTEELKKYIIEDESYYEEDESIFYAPESEKDLIANIENVVVYYEGNILGKEKLNFLDPLIGKSISFIVIDSPITIYYTFEEPIEFNVLEVNGNIIFRLYYDDGVQFKEYTDNILEAPVIYSQMTIKTKSLKFVIYNDNLVYIDNIKLIKHLDNIGSITLSGIQLDIKSPLLSIKPHNSSINNIFYSTNENFVEALKENDEYYIFLQENTSAYEITDELVLYQQGVELYKIISLSGNYRVIGPRNAAYYEQIGMTKHLSVPADIVNGRLSVHIDEGEIIPETVEIYDQTGEPLHPSILEVSNVNIEAQFAPPGAGTSIASVIVSFDYFDYDYVHSFFVKLYPAETLRITRLSDSADVNILLLNENIILKEYFEYTNKSNQIVKVKIEIITDKELSFINEILSINKEVYAFLNDLRVMNYEPSLNEDELKYSIIKIYDKENIVYACSENYLNKYIPYSLEQQPEFFFIKDGDINLLLKIEFQILNGIKIYNIL